MSEETFQLEQAEIPVDVECVGGPMDGTCLKAHTGIDAFSFGVPGDPGALYNYVWRGSRFDGVIIPADPVLVRP